MSLTQQHWQISAELERERWQLLRRTSEAFGEIRALVDRAFAAHEAGDLPEARILLNEAIDIECDVTGDAKVLGDLFEEWGGDHERDQRKCSPAPEDKLVSLPGDDGICQRCGLVHMGYCSHRTCTALNDDGECDSCGVPHAIGTECP